MRTPHVSAHAGCSWTSRRLNASLNAPWRGFACVKLSSIAYGLDGRMHARNQRVAVDVGAWMARARSNIAAEKKGFAQQGRGGQGRHQSRASCHFQSIAARGACRKPGGVSQHRPPMHHRCGRESEMQKLLSVCDVSGCTTLSTNHAAKAPSCQAATRAKVASP